jgi:hypothetical protein
MAEPQLKVSAFSQILSMSNDRTSTEGLCFYIYTSCKLVRCTGKLWKIKSKLILIHFTSYVEYVFFFSFFFFVVQNVVGKIDKETLQIGIDPTF